MRTYNYPDPGLKVGVSQSQLDFLVAVYVGAFTRAPEYEGLKYWGGYLARELAKKNEVLTVDPLFQNSLVMLWVIQETVSSLRPEFQ